MSLHKLSAGSRYDYLTRQVAALDATDKGHSTLDAYYSENGEAPGRWVGSGLAGIDGLVHGDVVTSDQMRALFAYGLHPLAAEQDGPEDAASESESPRHLGAPFKVFDADAPDYIVEVARRLDSLNVAAGRPRKASLPLEVRARVRSEVAAEFFERRQGRAPADSRELASAIARYSRPKSSAVSGYDLTFSPVKSVSTLWAVADEQVSARVERAHDAAVAAALEFIEREALFTRRGMNGVRQVDVRGLVATAFTHRDSRAGDPDLHTHVAVANKVQAVDDGAWLSIDGRLLYQSAVTASEVYNTALEKHLVQDLGVQFAERPGQSRGKRAVREIVGVDESLNSRWSSRRAEIVTRTGELAADFQQAHGRPPTPTEALELSQRATLETRDPKHAHRSRRDQRREWRRQAAEILGAEPAVARMVATALSTSQNDLSHVDSHWVNRTASEVVRTVQSHRSTWQTRHLQAEVLRRVRTADLLPEQVDDVTRLVLDHARDMSVLIVTDRDGIDEPSSLTRQDQSSIYSVAGSDLYSSQGILDAEARIVEAAGLTDRPRVPHALVDLALAEARALGTPLNSGQEALVRELATSGRAVQVALAPAGSGKTTAMATLAKAWTEAGGEVVALAPSAAASNLLGQQIGAPSETIAKFVHDLRGDRAAWSQEIGARSLVLIDEAGMADTLSLDDVIRHAGARGATVRLVGDDQQLAAVGAGGVLRDIDAEHGSIRLRELMRFQDAGERAATLALREGRHEAIGFYLDNQRVHIGERTQLIEEVFHDWRTDVASGRESIMLGPTREVVAELNARARQYFRALADHPTEELLLSDGNRAGVGDLVITRHNSRKLRSSATDWVKNGDRWIIVGLEDAGSLWVRHVSSGLRTTLPADYVADHVELGYATTVHAAQGVSVDTVRGIVTGQESRRQLYTLLTRGRLENHAYVITATEGDRDAPPDPGAADQPTATGILESVLDRDLSAKSATSIRREADTGTTRLAAAVARLDDGMRLAAGHVVGAEAVEALTEIAEDLVPGISGEPAWPTLRANLILRQADTADADAQLESAVRRKDLDGIEDRAALIDWRMREVTPTSPGSSRQGPPRIPRRLLADPTWGDYLLRRAQLVAGLSEETAPGAAPQQPGRTGDELDHRGVARARWVAAVNELQPLHDPFSATLSARLSRLEAEGLDPGSMLQAAFAEGPVPDDHASAALWWRIERCRGEGVGAAGQPPEGQPRELEPQRSGYLDRSVRVSARGIAPPHV
ncbi:MobF family relaxase [Aeromicrobium sp. Root495]|uniref:MobF family relaxase n=1 Tax=Aeromicrobium sp. Root495 TaxID=1736550 RepID=UPI000AB3CA3D|nr:MobF family relaxase [Aeromicrobium sp. Root495]